MLSTRPVVALGQLVGRPTSGQPVRPLTFRAASEHGLREEPW